MTYRSKSTYGESRNPPIILPAYVPSTPQVFRDEDERRSFEFFCVHSIPQTTRLAGDSFWSRLVPQLAVDEQALRLSLLSLGSLQRYFQLKHGEGYSLAILQYTQAVGSAQALVESAQIDGDYTKVLVCALLFHCIENFLGNHVLAKKHLRSGHHLSYEYSCGDKSAHATILSSYRRFDFQAMTFWDKSAPYELSQETQILLEALPEPTSFSNLNDAADVLMDLTQWMYYIHNLSNGRSPQTLHQTSSHYTQTERCRKYIELWNCRFKDFKAKHGTYLADFRRRCSLLTIYYLIARILIRHLPSDTETQWDEQESDFIRLLDLAEAFLLEDSFAFGRGILSAEMGIVAPLFETAIRCRNPHQRRRAVAMLRATPRREGIWDSYGAAAVAEFAIELEEEGLVNAEKASDVSEEQRIHFLDPSADLNKREIHVTFYRQSRSVISTNGEAGFEWDTRERLLHF